MRYVRLLLPLFLVSVSGRAFTAEPCPPAVRGAVSKLHPGARVGSCKPERDNGKLQYEVRISEAGRKLELDLTPEGGLLQTEERVPLNGVPPEVRSGFASKYPGVTAVAAEKQTKAGGATSFELAFDRAGKRHEATFTDQGAFVEEE